MPGKNELDALITNIANAIRTAGGTTDKLTLAQMPDAIRNMKPSPDKAIADIDAAWGTDAMWATIAKYGDTIRDNPSAFSKYVGMTATYSYDINGRPVSQQVRVVGVCHFDRSDGKGKAAFTFDHVGIPLKRQMNSSNTTSGGYPATAMKSFLEGGFYNGMPASIRNAIAPVTIPCSLTAGANPTMSAQRVFLLSEKEVFGTSGYANEGTQLAWYAANNTNAKRVKNYNGSADYWWLRSPYSPYLFGHVLSDGLLGTYSASYTNGVSPSFCIG